MPPAKIEARSRSWRPTRHRLPAPRCHRRQIADWDLPTRPTKARTPGPKGFGDTVELDAIEPEQLRKMVDDAIQRICRRSSSKFKTAEASDVR